MLRSILFGLWGCSITAGALFFGLGMAAEEDVVSKMEQMVDLPPRFSEPQVLVAPVVIESRISGFLFSSVVLELDAKASADISLPVELVLQDSYLAFLLGNPDFLFPRSSRFEALKFKAGLKKQINVAVGAQLVQSVYVSGVNFLASDEARSKQTLKSVWLQERTKLTEPPKKLKSKEAH